MLFAPETTWAQSSHVTILRDDHAGACTALHIAAAKPGAGADHLSVMATTLGCTSAILNRQVKLLVLPWIQNWVKLRHADLLDHNSAAGQAGRCGWQPQFRQATAKAKGYHTDAGRHTQQNLAAVALFGLVAAVGLLEELQPL